MVFARWRWRQWTLSRCVHDTCMISHASKHASMLTMVVSLHVCLAECVRALANSCAY